MSEESLHPVSRSAFGRIAALREIQTNAAKRMRSADDYPDFFVEGSGPPWHERWPEVIRGSAKGDFTTDRMLYVDQLRMDDYPDFFVEGSGPPWHERWPEVIRGNPSDPGQRARILQRLSVIQRFIDMGPS